MADTDAAVAALTACVGSEFVLVCNPTSDLLKYNQLTGMASATGASGLKVEWIAKCFFKQTHNGKDLAQKDFTITMSADPKALLPGYGSCVPKAGKAPFKAFCDKPEAQTPAGCAAPA
jgi:hypothetical protein